MTEYEYSELILMTAERLSDVFEFWITASFATVMVCFLGVRQLDAVVLRIVGGLYVLASIYLCLNYIGYSWNIGIYYEKMVQAGFDVSHLDKPINSFIMLSLIALFLLGVAGTIFYTIYSINLSKREHVHT